MNENMKNSHLEKSERNQRIRELLAKSWSQPKIAEAFGITVQRVNDLVQKWVWRGLLEKTEDGFVLPKKGRTPAKVIHKP